MLRERGVCCDFVIEREGGEGRDRDVVAARRLVERLGVDKGRARRGGGLGGRGGVGSRGRERERERERERRDGRGTGKGEGRGK
jgi:hypothetical protein